MQWLKEHDHALVREILLFMPWQHRHGSPERGMVWTQIAESLTSLTQPSFKPLDSRSVRERYKVLKKRFKKEDNEDKRASVTSPEQNETNDAVREIVEQFEEAAKMQQEMTAEEKKKQEQEVLQAEEMRQVSLESFGETRKRTKSNDEKSNGKTSAKVKCTETMKSLRERAAQEDQMKKDEMSIKKNELELQKQQQQALECQLNRQFDQTQQILQQQQQQNLLLMSLIQQILPNNKPNQ